MRRLSLLGVVLALLLGLAGGWSARSLLAAPAPLPGAPTYAVTTARTSTLHRSISLDATSAWGGGVDVSGQQSGTITRVVATPSKPVQVGDILYEVDLRPIVVGQGVIPAFRDLKIDDKGADVAQLQRFLAQVGVYDGQDDGWYGVHVAQAVRTWQKHLDVPVTGLVSRAAIIYVPSLPAAVTPRKELSVGSAAPVGSAAFSVRPTTPTFTLTMPPNQAQLIRIGTPLTLGSSKSQWRAQVSRLSAPREDGSVTATLGPPKGARSICNTECGQVPPEGGAVPAIIVIVPPTTGITVPAQALMVGPDGTPAVTLEDGTSSRVTVKTTVGGLAVIDGVKDGTRLRVPTSGV